MIYRKMTLQLTVTVPAATGENEVEQAINAVLDEPPCEWGDWTVSFASITGVERFEADDDDEDEVDAGEAYCRAALVDHMGDV